MLCYLPCNTTAASRAHDVVRLCKDHCVRIAGREEEPNATDKWEVNNVVAHVGYLSIFDTQVLLDFLIGALLVEPTRNRYVKFQLLYPEVQCFTALARQHATSDAMATKQRHCQSIPNVEFLQQFTAGA